MKCETCHMIVLEGAACARDDCPNGAAAPTLETMAVDAALEQRNALDTRLAKLDVRMAALIVEFPDGPQSDEERAVCMKLAEFEALHHGLEEPTDERITAFEAAVDEVETLLKARAPKAEEPVAQEGAATEEKREGVEVVEGQEATISSEVQAESGTTESEGSADAATTSESAAAQEEGANEQA